MSNSNWYKNAVFYSLDVETFFDTNKDGIGDFPGLIQKLDYIASLGITCIWLLPFYASPNRDNGYDIKDYYAVDPRLGTIEDFKQFVSAARQYGIRIIIDLVVNHTSVEHPWFQQARKDKTSPYYSYYVWSDEPLAYEKQHLMFTGEEDSIWTYDEAAKQYYLHRFYKEQPDLNISNVHVQQEILAIIKYWLDMGISGFRIDAAEMLIEPYGMKGAQKDDLAGFLDKMRNQLTAINPQAILLAEVNTGPDKIDTYLHKEGRMHMVFNFFINQHLFLSLAKEDTSPLVNALKALPPVTEENQWLNFLRHHDELSLSLLQEEEQALVFTRYAPEKAMRIYGRGIRRRIAPMLQGNRQQMELYYSLLFSVPGVPLIRYGDEIGMGDDLSLPGRVSVRTPMQWSKTKNGGFSMASREHLVHPVIDEGNYAYEKVNVEKAEKDQGSFLNWLKQLIALRKQYTEIGSGSMEVLPSSTQHLFIHRLYSQSSNIQFLHNIAGETIEIPALLQIGNGNILIGRDNIIEEPGRLMIKKYGYLWWRDNS
jgi:maltose alpha-D-glucosyltransferase/alpha-amylase